MKNTVIKKIYLEQDDYDNIKKLKSECDQFEAVNLKLELDYKQKLSDLAKNSTDGEKTIKIHQEYMCFDSDKLVGYLGICHFGGDYAPYEINGMVHPLYRRQHIFSDLMDQAIDEIKKNENAQILLLCDKKSCSGKNFIESKKIDLHHIEYEMYLDHKKKETYFHKNDMTKYEIDLVEATNLDAKEVTRQNQIFFSNVEDERSDDTLEADLILPEEEKKRGLFIYLAKYMNNVIGKIQFEIVDGVGGIYGFGVLPAYRKQGFGRKILWLAIRQLDQMKVNDIMLQVETKNSNALKLYESCGFVEHSVMEYYCF